MPYGVRNLHLQLQNFQNHVIHVAKHKKGRLMAENLAFIEDTVVYGEMERRLNENKTQSQFTHLLIDLLCTCGLKGHQTYKPKCKL